MIKHFFKLFFIAPAFVFSQTQIGSDIDGVASNNESGFSVSLSSDGSVLAIGAPYNAGNGFNSGQVRIFKNISSVWTQIGSDIYGESGGDQSGFSVSLSSNGSIIAIGARKNTGNGIDSGHVRVYDLGAIVLSTKSFELDYFAIYPNPVKDILNIRLDDGLELKKVNIYNSLGAYLLSTNELTINAAKLSSGIYFIELETNKGKSAKKIVID